MPVGWLADGTPYYAPIGEVVRDPDTGRVICHVCGRAMRAVAGPHLYSHGWTRETYIQAFGLLYKQTFVAADVSTGQSIRFRERLRRDSTMQEAVARGRWRAESGELGKIGRAALDARPVTYAERQSRRVNAAIAQEGHRAAVARRLAARLDELQVEDLASWLRRRRHVDGATVSDLADDLRLSQATVGKLLRHHGLAPRSVATRRATREARRRRRLNERVSALGYPSVETYLVERYLNHEAPIEEIRSELDVRDATVSKLITAAGLARPATTTARRNGRRAAPIGQRAYQKRATARRTARLAALGFSRLEDYLRDRYVRKGWTVTQITEELHISFKTLLPAMDAAGIPRRSRTYRLHPQSRWPEQGTSE